jgi:FtsP/CotA-like multicopper oxidase with cupredoxin domain
MGFLVFMLVIGTVPAVASVNVQCPADTDGVDTDGDGIVDNDHVCIHVVGGDSFINMADGRLVYTFGFSQAPFPTPGGYDVFQQHELAATFPAPTITVKEGQKLFLTLSTIPMRIRPDLFDPHTVHWHGFPNASTIFDGEPMASIAINPGESLTYFYNVVEPGTFFYHCHVEATEHMQMGMLGNLYVEPRQNQTASRPGCAGVGTKFAYNDGDCGTEFNVDFALQLSGFDPNFHDANENIQPLPFAAMKDTYMMINGRGYPDTINPNALSNTYAELASGGKATRPLPSRITATQGQRILLRISNVSTVHFTTLTSLGIPMRVVGKDARIFRGGGASSGLDLSYTTNSIITGGGQAVDVILDTSLVSPGTYFLYTNNLHELANNEEDYGGMMTEIVVN